MKKIISFPDSSNSFSYGVEYGRLLEKIERGDNPIQNNGFPVRLENVQLLKDTCAHYGYIATFGLTHFDEWIDFLGLKKETNNLS